MLRGTLYLNGPSWKYLAIFVGDEVLIVYPVRRSGFQAQFHFGKDFRIEAERIPLGLLSLELKRELRKLSKVLAKPSNNSRHEQAIDRVREQLERDLKRWNRYAAVRDLLSEDELENVRCSLLEALEDETTMGPMADSLRRSISGDLN